MGSRGHPFAPVPPYETAKRQQIAGLPLATDQFGEAQPALRLAVLERPPRCVGRDKEVGELVAEFLSRKEPIAALVMGGPGIGKTTLIQQALAHQEIDKKFEIRRWFVSLEHASDIQSFDAEIVRTLNLEPGTNRFSAAMGLLARDHSLIVLDNLERAWEANPVEIEARLRQLAAIPNVVLVASLRGQDAVLGVPWTKQLILGPLDIENSIQLFRQIAPKISSHDPYLRKLISCLGVFRLRSSSQLYARRRAIICMMFGKSGGV